MFRQHRSAKGLESALVAYVETTAERLNDECLATHWESSTIIQTNKPTVWQPLNTPIILWQSKVMCSCLPYKMSMKSIKFHNKNK